MAGLIKNINVAPINILFSHILVRTGNDTSPTPGTTIEIKNKIFLVHRFTISPVLARSPGNPFEKGFPDLLKLLL